MMMAVSKVVMVAVSIVGNGWLCDTGCRLEGEAMTSTYISLKKKVRRRFTIQVIKHINDVANIGCS